MKITKLVPKRIPEYITVNLFIAIIAFMFAFDVVVVLIANNVINGAQ